MRTGNPNNRLTRHLRHGLAPKPITHRRNQRGDNPGFDLAPAQHTDRVSGIGQRRLRLSLIGRNLAHFTLLHQS
ncbi:MAG: hypothetical protein HC828_04775 [Blastochloris sp.]|nr:hypothetical protein [Blastochloris sp.]